MPKLNQDVVIVGTGETPVGRLHGVSGVEIQAWAVRNALADCGLTLRDVDGLVSQQPYNLPNSGYCLTVAEYLGLRIPYCATLDIAGTATSVGMLQQAAWAIETGHCEVAVCVHGENSVTGRPKDTHGFALQIFAGGEEFEAPFGPPSPPAHYALYAQRYMHEYGTRQEDFGAVAVAHRNHALLNDNAVMKKPITLEDYMASKPIASPFKLLDCSIPVDGGGAVVVMSGKRARKLGLKGIRMRSIVERVTHNAMVGGVAIDELGLEPAAKELMNSAGIGPEDIDVAVVHDAFTISVILMLETFGFAKRGEAGDYIRAGHASLGGKCPLNTHGGLLSQGHFGGFLHTLEIIRQLQGKCGRRQVEGARIGMVSGGGGIFAVTSGMIMEGPAQ